MKSGDTKSDLRRLDRQVAAALGPPEWRARRSLNVLRLLVPLILASSAIPVAAASIPSSTGSSVLSTAPWWEKVTVTMAGDGKTQSCKYEASTAASGKACDVDDTDAASAKPTTKGEVTKITFERRFNPGATPTQEAMQVGDKLLGKQVMALAIDGGGKVSNCKIVDASGDMTPAYGCEEASAEHFEATKAAAQTRQGFMTILIYGHSEHVA
jgi:hypothetical protein